MADANIHITFRVWDYWQENDVGYIIIETIETIETNELRLIKKELNDNNS